MTVIIDATSEVLHLRTRVRLPAFTLYSAPVVFDQSRSHGARIRRSSTRFDRLFGNKRETRLANDGLVSHLRAPGMNDTFICKQFPMQNSVHIGLCHFVWALGHCDAEDGNNFLPQYDGASNIRLIGYIRSISGPMQVAEAIRIKDGFELDVFDLDEVDAWDGRTFVLTLTNPDI